MTARRLRHPPRRSYAWALVRKAPADPAALHRPRQFAEWMLDWRGLSLPVWDVEGDDPAGPTCVLTPGWGESRVIGLSRVPPLARRCSRILLWDPPGLGDAPPGPFLMGTREHEALRALLDRAGVAPRSAVLFGWSAGAGTSIAAASSRDERIAAVVAEAPYRVPWVPARNVMTAIGMPWTLIGPLTYAMLGMRLGVGPRWKGFDRAILAARLACPLLVIHGNADAVCPPSDGLDIAEALTAAGGNATLALIPGGAHTDLWTNPATAPACAAALDAFLSNLRPASPPSPRVGEGRREATG